MSFPVTRIAPSKSGRSIVFYATAPDDSVVKGGAKSVIGSIEMLNQADVEPTAKSLKPADFVLTDVDADGFGTVAKK